MTRLFDFRRRDWHTGTYMIDTLTVVNPIWLPTRLPFFTSTI